MIMIMETARRAPEPWCHWGPRDLRGKATVARGAPFMIVGSSQPIARKTPHDHVLASPAMRPAGTSARPASGNTDARAHAGELPVR